MIEFRTPAGRRCYSFQSNYPGHTMQCWTVIGCGLFDLRLQNEHKHSMLITYTLLDYLKLTTKVGDKFMYSDKTGLEPIPRRLLEVEL